MREMLGLTALPDEVTVVVRVAAIVLVALVAIALIRSAARIGVRHLLERREADAEPGVLPSIELERRVRTLQDVAVRIAAMVIAIMAALMILSEFEIDIGPAVAGLGVVGIAVGLGAQTLVRDCLAGIFIILENQYSGGDIVRVAGVEGVVEEFSLRRTTLRDLDGAVHTVPNGQVIVSSNLTRLWSRVNLDVAVGYEAQPASVIERLDRIGTDLSTDPEWADQIIEAPSVVRVEALTDPGVVYKVLGRVRTAEQWSVAGELRRRILADLGGEVQVRIP
jgi:moderate conductance mechanosensitive channel